MILREDLREKETGAENGSAFYRIDLPSDLDFIPPLRQFLAEAARAAGFSKKFCFRTEVVVDELCTNAVLHGSQDLSGRIQVEAALEAGRVELTVRDSGGSARNLEKLKKAVYTLPGPGREGRGRGLSIVNMLSDGLDIDIGKDGFTAIRVVKEREDRDAENGPGPGGAV